MVSLVADPRAADLAARLGTTRSAAAVELWADRIGGAVMAIGNAPTAVFRLLELVDDGVAAPAAVLGGPVGFVGSAQCKDGAHRPPARHRVSAGDRTAGRQCDGCRRGERDGRRPGVTGTLWGVGLGPGDPELVTVKAARVIGEADVVAYHSARHGRSIARGIAERTFGRARSRSTWSTR